MSGVPPAVVRHAIEAMHHRIRALEEMIEFDFKGSLDDAPPIEEAVSVLLAAVEAAQEAVAGLGE